MVFGQKVIFKGESSDYFKAIDIINDQTPLKKEIKLVFDNQSNKTKEQIMAELTLRKIFEDLLINNSIYEYKKV